MEESNDCILISKMYNNNTNAYSQQGENIVHEAINLLSADNGDNFIYIVPSGVIKDINKYGNIDTVILVRKASMKKTVEIIAKAEGLEYLGEVNKDAKYYGLSLTDYYDNNTYKGKSDANAVNVTFKVKSIYYPKKSIYLTNDENLKSDADAWIIYIGKKRLLNNSQRFYVMKNDIEYVSILELVNSDLWEKVTTPKLAEKEKEIKDNSDKGFMYAIGQQYNEHAYSNMFASIFTAYPKLFVEFCKANLNAEIDLSISFKVKREYNNIDIYIYDDNNIIVIENKIRSGINGISDKPDENGKHESQLSKYCSIIDKEKKTSNYFIFAPEYEINLLSSTKNKLKDGEKYKLVSYKEIYDYYYEHIIDMPFFKEFLLALKHHINPTDNIVEEQMIQRMLNIKHRYAKE